MMGKSFGWQRGIRRVSEDEMLVAFTLIQCVIIGAEVTSGTGAVIRRLTSVSDL